jgi:hypothetical protein
VLYSSLIVILMLFTIYHLGGLTSQKVKPHACMELTC